MAGVAENGGIRVVGRYALHGAIAAGGMATVHFGRLLGPVGFSRTVAIKRLHAQYAADPEFVSMFLDEARLAARIRHPNVVPTLDVVAIEGELFLVMEYVAGESLAKLTRSQQGRRPSMRIISSVMAGTLHGLHAAHEATDERGQPLGIVHRDVSPQNILVGTDGIPKILDFGVAKAAGRTQHTREGQIKGKLSYMPPEQLRGGNVTRAADVYSAGIVLWEVITGERLFGGDNEGVVITRILEGRVKPPSQVLAGDMKTTMTDRALRDLESLDRVVMRALDMNPDNRYATAQEMAIELERTVQPGTAFEVSEWVQAVARDVLHNRAAKVSEIESSTSAVDNEKALAFAPRSAQSGPQFPAAAGSGTGLGSSSSARPSMSGFGAAGFGSTARISVDPPVTQPSTISVSTGAHNVDQVRQRRTIAGAALSLVLLMLALIAGVSAWKIRSRSAADTAPADSASLAQTGQTSPTTAPTQNGLVNTGVTSGGLDLEMDAGAASVVAAPATAGTVPPGNGQVAIVPRNGNGGGISRPPPVRTIQPVAVPPPVVSAPKVADPCSPPYYYDAKGVKHYKEQCI